MNLDLVSLVVDAIQKDGPEPVPLCPPPQPPLCYFYGKLFHVEH